MMNRKNYTKVLKESYDLPLFELIEKAHQTLKENLKGKRSEMFSAFH